MFASCRSFVWVVLTVCHGFLNVAERCSVKSNWSPSPVRPGFRGNYLQSYRNAFLMLKSTQLMACFMLHASFCKLLCFCKLPDACFRKLPDACFYKLLSACFSLQACFSGFDNHQITTKPTCCVSDCNHDCQPSIEARDLRQANPDCSNIAVKNSSCRLCVELINLSLNPLVQEVKH